MKRTRLSTLSMLLLAAVMTSVGMKGCEEKSKAAEAAATIPPAIDVLQQYFRNAHIAFLKADYQAAVGEIRKGTEGMKTQTALATTDGKKLLSASIKELNQLAMDVNAVTPTVHEDQVLKNAFARAGYALAMHYHLKAMEYHSKAFAYKVGLPLKASTLYLKHGLVWKGTAIDENTKQVLNAATAVSDKLIQGMDCTPDEVVKALDTLGQEIAKCGKLVNPIKPAPEN